MCVCVCVRMGVHVQAHMCVHAPILGVRTWMCMHASVHAWRVRSGVQVLRMHTQACITELVRAGVHVQRRAPYAGTHHPLSHLSSRFASQGQATTPILEDREPAKDVNRQLSAEKQAVRPRNPRISQRERERTCCCQADLVVYNRLPCRKEDMNYSCGHSSDSH